MNQLQIQLYTDTSVFTQLKSEWQELLTRSLNNEVFLTPQFQSAWWNNLGRGELRVLTLRVVSTNQLVGLAPLFVDGGELAILGCVDVSDYLDIIVDQNYENEVYQQLALYLQQEMTDWHRLYFCSLRHQSATHQQFASLFATASSAKLTSAALDLTFEVKKTQQDVCPVIKLPADWDAYLDSLDRHQRHEIRRKKRKLTDETNAEFVLVEKQALVDETMSEFFRLHKLSSPEKKKFWDEAHQQFFREFAMATAEEGWFKLYFLKIKGEFYSSMLVLDYKNEFQLYNSGFDPDTFGTYSTGNVLTAYTIEQAIQLGRYRYDFLRGDEQYKFRFGAVAEPIYDLAINKNH